MTIMGWKKIRVWLVLLLSLCLVTACGDKEDDAEEQEQEQEFSVVPNAYFVGGETITAVPPEAEMYLSQLTTGEDGSFIYRYTGFADVNTSVQTYVELLRGEESGFIIVDSETLRAAAAPDYTTETGMVLLAKEIILAANDAEVNDAETGDAEANDVEPGDAEAGDAEPGDAEVNDAEPGDAETNDTEVSDTEANREKTEETAESTEKLIVVRLAWEIGQCEVSIGVEDKPVIEETGEETVSKNYGLSHVGALEYIKSLSPAVLALEGESMDVYNVYITNGFTYVDGEACLRVEIYSDDNTAHTNATVGTYFMSGNGEHIYRLDENGVVTEISQTLA